MPHDYSFHSGFPCASEDSWQIGGVDLLPMVDAFEHVICSQPKQDMCVRQLESCCSLSLLGCSSIRDDACANDLDSVRTTRALTDVIL